MLSLLEAAGLMGSPVTSAKGRQPVFFGEVGGWKGPFK